MEKGAVTKLLIVVIFARLKFDLNVQYNFYLNITSVILIMFTLITLKSVDTSFE